MPEAEANAEPELLTSSVIEQLQGKIVELKKESELRELCERFKALESIMGGQGEDASTKPNLQFAEARAYNLLTLIGIVGVVLEAMV